MWRAMGRCRRHRATSGRWDRARRRDIGGNQLRGVQKGSWGGEGVEVSKPLDTVLHNFEYAIVSQSFNESN